MTDVNNLRVLELYSGLGGYHWALKLAAKNKFEFQIVASIEINPIALEVYKYNFPSTNTMNRNITGLTADEINQMKIDMIVLSPPCQPFCRTGLQLDVRDDRTNSFVHILEILPKIQFKYIMLENVKGFEVSESRNMFVQILARCDFYWQEFLLNPLDFGIPNSRLRYYLIGKHKDIKWSIQLKSDITLKLPMSNETNIATGETIDKTVPYDDVIKREMELWKHRRRRLLTNAKFDVAEDHPFCVADILEDNDGPECFVDEKIIQKYYQVMDIVHPLSTRTCCFTKSYGHYVKGTGSVLSTSTDTKTSNTDTKGLRYFSFREVARLMCYPDEVQFPTSISARQHYKALGNSLNVYVVAILISLLLSS